jgi:hypothetical protein
LNTQAFGWAKIAIHYAKDDPYAGYYREALEHAGLRAESLDQVTINELGRFHVLLLCGYGQISASMEPALRAWLQNGGVIVCSGSLWGLERLLGVEGPTHLSKAITQPCAETSLWPEGANRARLFGGVGVRTSLGEPLAQTEKGQTLLSRLSVGKGAAYFYGAHVGQTIALMQNGRSVECDGIGPDDGTAVLDDGNLRAEDGCALDFAVDRSVAGDANCFFEPHADIVREIWVRTILDGVNHTGLSTIILWHWPRHRDAVAMLSLDCEDYDPDKARQLHRMLTMYGCRAVWLVGLPGYGADHYRAMRSWQHELGLLFVTDDHTGWQEDKMKIQLTAVSRLASDPSVVTARPLDGKWRGWLGYYDICEAAGARVSLAKGGRQPGTMGFLFGTSRPYFPLRRDGSSYFTMEMPYSVYLPGRVTSDEAVDRLIQEAYQRQGCLHVVMRPECVLDSAISTAVRRLLTSCKEKRMEFVLAQEVYALERARRQMRVFQRQAGDEGLLQIVSDSDVPGFSLLVTGARVSGETKGKELDGPPLVRYGVPCTAFEFNLGSKQQVDVRIHRTRLADAA